MIPCPCCLGLNKKKYEKIEKTKQNLETKQTQCRYSHYHETMEANSKRFIHSSNSKLSKADSKSVNLFDELQNSSLYKLQQVKLEVRKSKSTESLEKHVHFLHSTKQESNRKTVSKLPKRRSTSLSNLKIMAKEMMKIYQNQDNSRNNLDISNVDATQNEYISNDLNDSTYKPTYEIITAEDESKEPQRISVDLDHPKESGDEVDSGIRSIFAKDINWEMESDSPFAVRTLDRYPKKIMPQPQFSIPTPDLQTIDFNLERRGKGKFRRKPIRKQDISSPINFRHIGHVGVELKPTNLSHMRFLSRSTEVLRNLQMTKDEPLPRGVGPFPRADDTHFLSADVQIRSNRNGSTQRQSKTMDFDVPRRSPSKSQEFDVKGVTKVHLPSSNIQLKLDKNEYIKYQNNTIFIANDSLGKLEPLKSSVILKSMKSLNKREVELRDSNNQVYLLIFDSSKDSKHFMENEKVSNLLDNKTTLSKTLLRLLGKRSSREVLEKKGIYQNEPIFGNTLRNIFSLGNEVPTFITKTMELIESDENVTSLGLYRTCGNLATIQKIRLEVDKGNLNILDAYSKDPDVLTGALKLFFRELKEPLMSCQTCDNLLGIMRNDKNYSSKEKLMIRTILSHLPEANSATLSILLKHLVEVVKYKDQNKMDSYNLATCWGPTVIFATEFSDSAKDLVTQSAEATRLFDSLLTYYTMYPEELDFQKRKHDFLDSNKSMLQREDSKDSIHSSDSNGSKLQKKSSSSLSLEDADEAVRKCVELIENASTDGQHKKSGSTERVNKIVKKMAKKKISEMEKYKNDVYELIEALKKYLKQDYECLVTKEAVEQITKICDNKNCLEHSTRQKVIWIIRDLPKKETLIFLIRHLTKLMEKEALYRGSKSDLVGIWAKLLIPEQFVESEEHSKNCLKILLEVLDESKSDVSMKPKGIPDGLLDALKNHPNMRDRVSKYDNVPDESDFNKEETILEEKTDEYENTKL
ncbi:uncharacterized protein isoform X2 [Leptinotarsa decemlineata]|uniref:uncharacterized protein isoform X2 n=1 Tax=Leptinotarsa decemlineata TaxID=7539 RepID=UPI003D30418E